MSVNLDKLRVQNLNLKTWNALAIIGLLIALTIVFSTNTEVVNENNQINNEKDSIVNETEISKIEYQSELLLKNSEYNSVKSDIGQGLDVIKNEIQKIINKTESLSAKKSLINLKNELANLSMLTTSQDTINVIYYLRSKDNTDIVQTIENINYTNYNVIRKKPEANRDKENNVVYYGKYVPQSIVDTLVNTLRRTGVAITRVKPFIMGYKYKETSLEIGYEQEDETTIANQVYNIRLYSFKPNVITKNRIANTLVNQGYQVNVLPDWNEKENFFSEESTILYYNSNLNKATEIAQKLNNKVEEKFSVRRGSGIGISESEKDNIFIIHYNGS